MHRIDGPGYAPGNLFTEGNPAVPTQATTVTADWLNAVQEEIAAVIEGAGDTLDKPDNGQLLAAIDTLIAAAVAGFTIADGSVTAAKLAATLDLSGKTLTLSAAQKANDYLEYRDEKASGTAGGTFTSGAWQTRTLTAEVHDTGGHGSLASNQITLAAGTYECEIGAIGYACGNHQVRLRNITDGASTLVGFSQNSNNGSTVISVGTCRGRFTIAASKVFEIQHRCSVTVATNGFGLANSFGENEVYTVARLWKVG